jgi:hypothetical protein
MGIGQPTVQTIGYAQTFHQRHQNQNADNAFLPRFHCDITFVPR